MATTASPRTQRHVTSEVDRAYPHDVPVTQRPLAFIATIIVISGVLLTGYLLSSLSSAFFEPTHTASGTE